MKLFLLGVLLLVMIYILLEPNIKRLKIRNKKYIVLDKYPYGKFLTEKERKDAGYSDNE